MVSDNNNGYVITFSKPVTINGGATPDGAFVIFGSPPFTVTSTGPATAFLDYAGDTSPGRGWSMTTQPNWLTTPATTPETGTTT